MAITRGYKPKLAVPTAVYTAPGKVPPWCCYGIDVSHHQHPDKLDELALIENHIGVLTMRTAYGGTADRHFRQHWAEAKARCSTVKRQPYHYWRPSVSNRIQFDLMRYLLDAVGYGPGDCIPVLDIEKNHTSQADMLLYTKDNYARAEDMAAMLSEEYGDCILYSGSQWLHTFCGGWTSEYPIWTAEYRGLLNYLGPRPAKTHRLIGWQFEGRADHNYHFPGVFKGAGLDANVWAEVRAIQ